MKVTIPTLTVQDQQLATFGNQTKNAIEKIAAAMVTQDDLKDLKALATKLGSGSAATASDMSVSIGGLSGTLNVDALAGKLVNNNQMKSAFGGTTAAPGQAPAQAPAVISATDPLAQARLDTLTKVVDEHGTKLLEIGSGDSAGASRGPVRASVHGQYWSDQVAVNAIHSVIKNSQTDNGTATGAASFLVTGDTVMFANEPNQYNYYGYEHTRQYVVGKGWIPLGAPFVAFAEVNNLQTYHDALTTVIPARSTLANAAKVRGVGLATGVPILNPDGSLKSPAYIQDPSLADIVHQLDWGSPNTQSNSTLMQLQNFQHRINALEQRKTVGTRDPITNGFGQLPFEARGINYVGQWYDSVASWCVLYRLYGGQFPTFYDPMPTTWLIPGDRCRLTDNPGGGTTGGTFDETRSWTGTAWV